MLDVYVYVPKKSGANLRKIFQCCSFLEGFFLLNFAKSTMAACFYKSHGAQWVSFLLVALADVMRGV
jgi:hypothetical protein